MIEPTNRWWVLFHLIWYFWVNICSPLFFIYVWCIPNAILNIESNSETSVKGAKTVNKIEENWNCLQSFFIFKARYMLSKHHSIQWDRAGMITLNYLHFTKIRTSYLKLFLHRSIGTPSRWNLVSNSLLNIQIFL